MKRALALALAAAAALPGAAVPGTVPGTVHPEAVRTIGTRGRVDSISADGGRVAIRSVLESTKRNCMYASVWTPASNAVKRFDEGNACVDRDEGNEEHHLSLTMAGTRVAWANFEYGNHAYCQGFFSATLSRPRAAELPSPCDPGEGVSDYFFRVSGDSRVLAYASYQFCDIQCTDDNGELLPEGEYDIEIRTVVGGKVRLVDEPPDRSFFVGVSRARLLTFEHGRGLVVRDAGGRVLHEFAIAENQFDDVFFSGSNIVLRHGATLAVHDATTFATTGTSAIKARRVDDLDKNLAVYRAGGHVRVVDLANGKDAIVATPSGTLVLAGIEPDGVYYGYNVRRGPKPGRVTFVPMATVRAKLGR